MTTKKENIKTGIDIMNEAERAHAIIDRYIRNEGDREELKKNLTPAIITFLLRWDTDKEMVMEERIVEIVMKKMQDIYLADNAALCKSVATVVQKELAESLAAWNIRLGGIETSLKDLKTGQKNISDKIDQIVVRVQNLETFEDVALKDLDYLKKTQGWRIIALRIGIAVLISAIITIFAIQIHNKKTNRHKASIENIIK